MYAQGTSLLKADNMQFAGKILCAEQPEIDRTQISGSLGKDNKQIYLIFLKKRTFSKNKRPFVYIGDGNVGA